ncbi:MAG: ABC transporter ATP-binding protein [Desulfobacterium sp.]
MVSNLIIDRVSKHYKDTIAADNISLDIKAGEFVTLLGPSGSGKTTLLMMVAGFTPIDNGDIFMDDQRITKLPPHKRNIGMVFQNYALFPHMTVARNIEYPLKLRRIRAKKRQDMIQDILKMVRLQGFEHRMPSELSGGQKQRVALARAMVFNPPVLLMDEPLSALDKKLREQMQLELKSIQEQMGITVLYVTHDQEEALTMSGRIAVMNHGKIQQIGTPSQIYNLPGNKFVAKFIGETNFFPSIVEESNGQNMTVLAPGNHRAILAPTKVMDKGTKGYLSVRPEDVLLVNGNSPCAFTLKGSIEEILFLGDAVKYFIRLKQTDPDSPSSLVVAKHPSHMLSSFPNTGETVAIGWKSENSQFVV